MHHTPMVQIASQPKLNKMTFLNQAYAGLAAEDIAIAASAAAGGPGSALGSTSLPQEQVLAAL